MYLPKKGLLVLLVGISLVGCSRTSKNHHSREKKTLRIALPSSPNSLDPRKSADFVSPPVHFMLYEGLVRMTQDSTHEKALAEKIEISEDGLIYTFRLRNSLWSDGSLVTAFDFAYAWKTMLEPSFPCPNAYLLYPIKNAKAVKTGLVPLEELGIKALDAETFQVILEAPTPHFLDIISYCLFSPVPHKIVEKDPTWADSVNPHLVTNGAFILQENRLGDRLVFAKNPNYWDSRKVGLEGIEAYIIADELTGLKMFQQKELEFFGGFLNALPTDSIPSLQRAKKLKKNKVGATTFISFNLTQFPFTNKNIRKAFAYAINRQEIIDNITQLDEEVGTNYIASVLKGGKRLELYKDADEISAKRHLEEGLKELGCDKKGLGEITFTYTTNALQKKVAQALQAQWRDVLGIDVKMDEGDFKVQFDKFTKRDYQLGQSFLVVQFNDQMNVFERFKERTNPKNYPGWENATYISLLEKSIRAPSEVERLSLLEKAEEVMADDMPLSCVFHWNGIFLEQDYVKDFYMSPIGSIHWNRAYFDSEEP